MPNYRYNTPDYMRRNNNGRPFPTSGKSCCEPKVERDPLQGMPLAMAYVPWQEWRSLYEPEKGFHQGTIFEELDKPFRGTGGCCQ